MDIQIIQEKQTLPKSLYHWANIEKNGERIGKIRFITNDKTLTIYSITIFPEHQHRGYAKSVIDYTKEKYTTIEADRVRYTAIGFWEKMNFLKSQKDNFIWQVDHFQN